MPVAGIERIAEFVGKEVTMMALQQALERKAPVPAPA